MKIISHRGFSDGIDESIENKPSEIESRIGEGFDVEIDLWVINSRLWLGHNEGVYKVDIEWLLEYKKNLWIHCKNQECLEKLNTIYRDLNFFWHENDLFTLTSKNYIWAYPSTEIFLNAINVLPEVNIKDSELKKKKKILGICTDYPKKYYSLYKN